MKYSTHLLGKHSQSSRRPYLRELHPTGRYTFSGRICCTACGLWFRTAFFRFIASECIQHHIVLQYELTDFGIALHSYEDVLPRANPGGKSAPRLSGHYCSGRRKSLSTQALALRRLKTNDGSTRTSANCSPHGSRALSIA